MMQATTDHVRTVMTDGMDAMEPGGPRETAAYVSHLALETAQATAVGDDARAAVLAEAARHYSDSDWWAFFAQCASAYVNYGIQYRGVLKYNDWKVEGQGDLSYGVIDWKLPNDAVVGIIGDWGTGLDDARMLLRDLMVQHKPAVLIHLGDIYYSATPAECVANYAKVITSVFDEVLGVGKRIPVFTLAGNHDYYSFGYGFLDTVNQMNAGLPGASQPASYFCLRSADLGWQFLAMDSSYYDSNPANQKDFTFKGPPLRDSEVQWLHDKIDTFAGATVLLSHHQLFTANANINGVSSGLAPYRNTYLQDAFQQYFATDVAAWMWGHEHNFVAYQNGLFGLAKGRLVGCSAYEEETTSNPYAVNWPQVPYLDPVRNRVDQVNAYYNHGYAVIKLGGRAQPDSPITAEYYQYPSWGTIWPAPPAEVNADLLGGVREAQPCRSRPGAVRADQAPSGFGRLSVDHPEVLPVLPPHEHEHRGAA